MCFAFAHLFSYTYARDKVWGARSWYVYVYIACMNVSCVDGATYTTPPGQSTTDRLVVDYRHSYSDTSGSTESFQFNVPSSRQYIPLYYLHTDMLEFVLE